MRDPRAELLAGVATRESIATTATSNSDNSSFAPGGSVAPSIFAGGKSEVDGGKSSGYGAETVKLDEGDLNNLPNGLNLEKKKKSLQFQILVIKGVIALLLVILIALVGAYIMASSS